MGVHRSALERSLTRPRGAVQERQALWGAEGRSASVFPGSSITVYRSSVPRAKHLTRPVQGSGHKDSHTPKRRKAQQLCQGLSHRHRKPHDKPLLGAT